jgi:drug/metabolite transporter (DMT)-like permease
MPGPGDRISGLFVNTNNLQGMALFLIALLLFSVVDSTAKYLVAFFAVPLVVWARYFVHLVLMLVLVVPGVGREIVVTGRPGLMIVRGLTLVASSLFIVLAFRSLPLAETTAIFFLTPVLVALLAGPLLGERLHARTWLATLGGFVGVLLIARPGSALLGIGVVYALCAALSYAFYQLLTRKLSATEPVMRQLFYTALIGTLAMSVVLPFFWTGEIPTSKQGMLIVSLGIFGGTGHFLLIRAFRETPASSLSPMLYFQLVFAALLGWVVFDQYPDPVSLFGMLIICSAGLSLALRRSRVGV